jgi:hypothetical protein
MLLCAETIHIIYAVIDPLITVHHVLEENGNATALKYSLFFLCLTFYRHFTSRFSLVLEVNA